MVTAKDKINITQSHLGSFQPGITLSAARSSDSPVDIIVTSAGQICLIYKIVN